MKLNHTFSLKEKFLIFLALVIVLVVCYGKFFSGPLEERLKNEKEEQVSLEKTIASIQTQTAEMEKMKRELDTLKDAGKLITMPSYNAQSEEQNMLNLILKRTTDFKLNFQKPTQNGKQIRRDFVISFNTQTYDQMEQVLEDFANSKMRCLISDVQVVTTQSKGTKEEPGHTIYAVQMTGTFYETMVGGTWDPDLPPQDPAASDS